MHSVYYKSSKLCLIKLSILNIRDVNFSALLYSEWTSSWKSMINLHIWEKMKYVYTHTHTHMYSQKYTHIYIYMSIDTYAAVCVSQYIPFFSHYINASSRVSSLLKELTIDSLVIQVSSKELSSL